MSILVYLEQVEGSIKKSSLEAVSYAKSFAEKTGEGISALALGAIEAAELAKVGKAGAEKVLHITDERFAEGNIQAHSRALVAAFQKEGAKTLVLAKSSLGDAVAARVSVILHAGLVSNVVELPDTNSGFKVRRSIYTGKAFAQTSINTDYKILSIKKNAVDLRTDGSDASVETFDFAHPEDTGVKVTAVEKAKGDILLPEADIVVSGGRGLKGPENWVILEDLAAELGAALGCSKPVSDLGWRPHHEHVGQTGIKVSPSLYIAVGISGAIQHLAGVNGSRVIVVINNDPAAPFFKAADYGIVGDAFEVLPKLTEAVRALKK